jgi:hypothetical protein
MDSEKVKPACHKVSVKLAIAENVSYLKMVQV